MADLSRDVVIGQLLAVLREAFEGAERWSYFTNHGPEGALFGTLARLSAAEASRTVGGTSIAAHAHHVAFGLNASSAWIRGDRTPPNWPESWRVSTVDDTGWAELQQRLRDGYRGLREAIESHGWSSLESYGGAVGAITHVAYHLGAIRQKVAFVRAA